MLILRSSGQYTQDPALVAAAAKFCRERTGSIQDTFAPLAGEVIDNLATGVSGSSETSLGEDSLGNTRPNDNACP